MGGRCPIGIPLQESGGRFIQRTGRRGGCTCGGLGMPLPRDWRVGSRFWSRSPCRAYRNCSEGSPVSDSNQSRTNCPSELLSVVCDREKLLLSSSLARWSASRKHCSYEGRRVDWAGWSIWSGSSGACRLLCRLVCRPLRTSANTVPKYLPGSHDFIWTQVLWRQHRCTLPSDPTFTRAPLLEWVGLFGLHCWAYKHTLGVSASHLKQLFWIWVSRPFW